jgi:2-polyprenyl-3-methyl-5-hydroxy-6-metoxy-1,4-benzoquinol methylase
MFISEEYKLLNQQLHKEREDYGVSGHKYANHIIDMEKHAGIKTVLDYGCGKGTLRSALIGKGSKLEITNYDPCIPEHSTKPTGKFDIVVCTDVIEHIEPEFTDDVLYDIHDYAEKFVVLAISTVPAQKKLPDGRNTHINLRGPNFWARHLINFFQFQQIQLMPSPDGQSAHGIYFLGMPK